MNRSRRTRPMVTEELLDDEVPFDEMPKPVEFKQDLKSPSLCRSRSQHVAPPQTQDGLQTLSMARAATHTGLYRGARSRPVQVTPNETLPKNDQMDFLPKTTTYTPLPAAKSRSTGIHNSPSGGVNEITDDDDDSSSFSDSSSSSNEVDENSEDDGSSFGSAVSSLSGLFSDFENSTTGPEGDDDGTNATFSRLGHSVGTTTLLMHYADEDTNFSLLQPSLASGTYGHDNISNNNNREDDTNVSLSLLQPSASTLGDNNTKNKQGRIIKEKHQDDSSQNSMETEDAYTTFHMNKERSGSTRCGRMMCCVDDSEYGELEDYLDTHNRQGRRKVSNKKTTKNVTPEKQKGHSSYFCQSLDCLGVLSCFWKNESIDATVKTSDF